MRISIAILVVLWAMTANYKHCDKGHGRRECEPQAIGAKK